jgi:hypothetical protein
MICVFVNTLRTCFHAADQSPSMIPRYQARVTKCDSWKNGVASFATTKNGHHFKLSRALFLRIYNGF